MSVTVYGKTRGCVQCDATKRRLDKLGVDYTFTDVNEDAEALDHILRLGYQQVPVVEHPGGHFSGYRPDLLGGLIGNKEAAA